MGICYMCRQQDKSVRHLFSECPVSEQIYNGVLQEAHPLVWEQDKANI